MRQLAAILFADMTGYTALMQENEQLAKLKRKRLKEVLDTTIGQFGGRVLQFYGDGSLSIFQSAIDGVHCAMRIQQALQQAPKVDVRIGLHTGDVTIEDEAIYGDGVNLASRIESLAVSGSIFISEKVFDEIRNQADILTRELGYFEMKNVKEPVRVFAIANPGMVVPERAALQGKTRQPVNRLAVLPFMNMSADPENEYFSDGITEELLNALTKINGLQVTSRTSAFAFKGKHADIRDIAIQLNVDKVLEGSVRKAGNRVRVTAQLINAADGYHLWSENYDRDLTDIFALQDEISGMIANKLRENLIAPTSPSPIKSPPSQNIEAYTCYLKGLHYWNKMTPGDTKKAIECFEQAIALEPEYALAYAMTATAYSQLGSSGQMLPATAFEIAHRYADKALQLDSTVAEGYIAKGAVYLLYDWKWAEAHEALQKALHLNPGATTVYRWLGFYYVLMGQQEQAITVMEEALKLDPLSTFINHSLGNIYVFAARYDDAIRQADKLLEIDPQMRMGLELKAWSLGMKGDWPAALQLFAEVHRLTNHPQKGLMGLGYAYAMLGEREKALDCIARIEQRQAENPDLVLNADMVGIWYALGDMDKTFYHINQCVEKRLAPVNYFLEYPVFAELKKDPRYLELKNKAGL
ncbi:MAG TPA: tetratricopeptide repeat protein [Ohtaekwangia sp.]|uniref:tetratricopeptide repeat protein n=1 Tax=Ohtaekwangia sp. TaxID=2066019 RepID=UPI002F91CDC8